MRTLRYLIEFIIIHFLFIIFKFIGYEKASNLGYKIDLLLEIILNRKN